MDSFKHINNALYLTYLEDARIDLFKRWNLNDSNKSIIVASIKINYYKQIRHPSNLIVGQKISRIGTKSFDIESSIYSNNLNEFASSSIVTCVCYNFNDNVSVPVYKEIVLDLNI